MVDIMMISHLGNSAVAAVGFANRVQFFVLVIVTGLSWGVSILSAQNYGAGKVEKIRSTILMGIVLGILALLPIVILTFFFADTLIGLSTTDQSVIDIGEEYLWITMPSLLFVAATMVYENALRSVSQVKMPLLFSIVAIMLNVVLNYWLIYGGLGIEPLGVAGAAIATFIARALHLLAIVISLKLIKHNIKPSRADIKALVNLEPWWQLIRLALPLMIGFGLWSLGSLVYQLIYGRMGTEQLAVISILVPIEAMFVSFFFGFASACAIMVGQQLGANDFKQGLAIAKVFGFMAPITAMLLGLILLFCQHLIFMPFSNMPEQTLALASDVFVIIALGAWIKITNITMSLGVLRPGGENKVCVYIDLFGMWIISIPLTILAAFYFELSLFYVVLFAYSEEIFKLGLYTRQVMKRRWLRNLSSI